MKNNLATKLLTALCLLMGAMGTVTVTINEASAQQTVNLNFSATETPSPCLITSGAQSAVDYGLIARSSLSLSGMTALGDRAIPTLIIQCESPTSIGLRASDNRTGIINYGTLRLADGSMIGPAQTDRRFSLGMTSDNRPVGVWGVAFSQASVDGAPADISTVAGNGALQADKTLHNDGTVTTWGIAGQPALGRVFTIDGSVSAGVAQLSSLPASSDVMLDGLVTIEVVYL